MNEPKSNGYSFRRCNCDLPRISQNFESETGHYKDCPFITPAPLANSHLDHAMNQIIDNQVLSSHSPVYSPPLQEKWRESFRNTFGRVHRKHYRTTIDVTEELVDFVSHVRREAYKDGIERGQKHTETVKNLAIDVAINVCGWAFNLDKKLSQEDIMEKWKAVWRDHVKKLLPPNETDK